MKTIKIKLQGTTAVSLKCDCGYATWHHTGFEQYCPDCDEMIYFKLEKEEVIPYKIYPFQYTTAPSCLSCHWNDICSCGEFGDKGICLLYKERDENE